MPLYDYQCDKCNHVREVITRIDDIYAEPCPKCATISMHRIISCSGVNCANQDADWLKSAAEITEKGQDAHPADVEFRKNPTRANYHAWMKARGIRPLDHGERFGRPDKPIDDATMTRKLWERYQARHKVEV